MSNKNLTLALNIKTDSSQAQQQFNQLQKSIEHTAKVSEQSEQKTADVSKYSTQATNKQADAVEQLTHSVNDLAQAQAIAQKQSHAMGETMIKNAQSTEQHININQRMEQSLKALMPHFVALIGLSGGLLHASMQALEKSAELKNLSTISGMNVEQFQYYAVGAKSVGIEMEKLSDIFKDTRDKVGDFLATGGGELKDFFDVIAPQVGVTAEQFRHLSGADALQLYVDSLRKANISENEMIFYMESIADEASALLPLLNQGGEGFRKYGEQAKQAGTILSQSTVEDALKAKSAISSFQKEMEGVGNRMIVNMIPAIKFVAEHFDVLVKAGIIVASVFAGRMASSFIATSIEMIKLQAQTMATAIAQARLGEVSLLTATRLNALTMASRLLTASGGLIGLGVAVASTIAGFLLMRKSSDQLSTSLDEQKKSVSELKQEYNALSESQKRVKQQEQIGKVNELTQAYKEQAQALRALATEAYLRGSTSAEEKKRIDELLQAYREGKLTAEQFANELNKLSSVSQELKHKIDQQAGATTTAKQEMDSANHVLATYQGKANLATSASQGLANGIDGIANSAENATNKVAGLSREYLDFIKSTQDSTELTRFEADFIEKGLPAELAKTLAKAQQLNGADKPVPRHIIDTLVTEYTQKQRLNKLTEQNQPSNQKTNSPRVVGIVGNTGIGSGVHLDIRRADGKKPSNDDLERFRAGGKRLTDYKMTSGYGQRNTGIQGASTFHPALDFAIPKMTPITTTVPVKDVKKWYDNKGGGWVSEVIFADGLVMKLLHQDPSIQQKVSSGTSASSTAGRAEKASYQYSSADIKDMQRVQSLVRGSELGKIAQQYGVPVEYLEALMMQESRGKQNAKSPTGALGYFQTTSVFRKQWGLTENDSYDLIKSGTATIKSLALAFKEFGNWDDAMLSHNAGMAGTRQFKQTGRVSGSESRNREVQNYLPQLLKWGNWYGYQSNNDDVTGRDYLSFVQAQIDSRKQAENEAKRKADLQADLQYQYAPEPIKLKMDYEKQIDKIKSAGFDIETQAQLLQQAEQDYQDKLTQRPEKLKAVYDELKQIDQHYIASTLNQHEKNIYDIEHQFDDFLAKIDDARAVTDDPLHLKEFDDMEYKIKIIIDKEKLKAEYEHAMAELDKLQAEKQQKIELLQQRYDSSNMTAHEFHTQKTAIDDEFNPRLNDMAIQAQQLAYHLNDAFNVEKLNLFIAGLNQAQTSFQQFLPTAEQLNDRITNGLTDAFFAFADGTKTAEEAFREFASAFFREIAQMILKQMIFNAISSAGKAGGGGWGGALAGVVSSAFGGKGYSSGGYTGAGGKYEPAGIVHRDEFVIRKEMTNQVGAKQFLAQFNRYGMQALKGLQGYSSGGLIGANVANLTAPQVQAPKLSSPSEKIAQSTSFNANQNFYLVDDPSRILDTLNSSQGQENLVVMMSRDPEKFKTALKIG